MKQSVVYLASLIGVALAGFAVLHAGGALEATGQPPVAGAGLSSALLGRLDAPLSRLLVQIVAVLAVARFAGMLLRRLGLPGVVGEMVAGILLGPSLFGLIAPQAFAALFPADSLASLNLVSQIGICLFMFSVGMALSAGHLRNRARAVVAVSHASIVVPFLFGLVLALLIYRDYAGPAASFVSFALFMGISMSITAFPMLARILAERGLTHTPLGAMAIACAAVDDITAWTMLAFVVAISGAAGLSGAFLTLGLAGLFLASMLLVVRPLLPRLIGGQALIADDPGAGTLTLVAGLVAAAALITEVIGIHALFGAFVAGAVMPEVKGFRQRISVRIEGFSTVMLVPLFFAFTGLRTRIDLLADGWPVCLAVIVLATAGKLGASAAAARIAGMDLRQALQIGALMNTRGLMELIALNIGYDMGILSPSIFTVLVLMALATTVMTGPLLTLFSGEAAKAGRAAPAGW